MPVVEVVIEASFCKGTQPTIDPSDGYSKRIYMFLRDPYTPNIPSDVNWPLLSGQWSKKNSKSDRVETKRNAETLDSIPQWLFYLERHLPLIRGVKIGARINCIHESFAIAIEHEGARNTTCVTFWAEFFGRMTSIYSCTVIKPGRRSKGERLKPRITDSLV